MSQPSAEAFFEAYLRYHANNEIDGVLELFEGDARVEDPVGSPAHDGIEAIRAFYAGTHARSGTMTIERVGSFLVGGDELAAHVRAGLNKSGSPPPMDVIYTVRISDAGRIVSLRAWY